MTTDLSPSGDTDRLAAALAEVNRLDAVDLLALYYLIERAIPAAEFPRLILASRVIEDDGETYAQRYVQCPHCDDAIGNDDTEQIELISVDVSTRHTEVADLYFDSRIIGYEYDGSTDYEGLTYLCGHCSKPVRLPEDWREQ